MAATAGRFTAGATGTQVAILGRTAAASYAQDGGHYTLLTGAPGSGLTFDFNMRLMPQLSAPIDEMSEILFDDIGIGYWLAWQVNGSSIFPYQDDGTILTPLAPWSPPDGGLIQRVVALPLGGSNSRLIVMSQFPGVQASRLWALAPDAAGQLAPQGDLTLPFPGLALSALIDRGASGDGAPQGWLAAGGYDARSRTPAIILVPPADFGAGAPSFAPRLFPGALPLNPGQNGGLGLTLFMPRQPGADRMPYAKGIWGSPDAVNIAEIPFDRDGQIAAPARPIYGPFNLTLPNQTSPPPVNYSVLPADWLGNGSISHVISIWDFAISGVQVVSSVWQFENQTRKFDPAFQLIPPVDWPRDPPDTGPITFTINQNVDFPPPGGQPGGANPPALVTPAAATPTPCLVTVSPSVVDIDAHTTISVIGERNVKPHGESATISIAGMTVTAAVDPEYGDVLGRLQTDSIVAPGVYDVIVSVDGTECGRGSLAGEKRGRDAAFAYFGQLAEATGGTFRAELHDVAASGDHVVGLHTATGQRQGRSLQLHEALVFHLRDSKITEGWEHYEDTQTWDEFFR